MVNLIIVDDKDNAIDLKERSILTENDIYRVAVLWITNSNDEILLAQRALDKKKDPGMWGPAVAGTVEEGESYKSNIIKEAEEEIGLKNIKPKKLDKSRTVRPHNHFTQWFKLVLDKKINDFNINKEVKKIKWFSKKDLKKKIKEDPDDFVYSMVDVIDKLL